MGVHTASVLTIEPTGCGQTLQHNFQVVSIVQVTYECVTAKDACANDCNPVSHTRDSRDMIRWGWCEGATQLATIVNSQTQNGTQSKLADSERPPKPWWSCSPTGTSALLAPGIQY
jgi:hypothetical protein